MAIQPKEISARVYYISLSSLCIHIGEIVQRYCEQHFQHILLRYSAYFTESFFTRTIEFSRHLAIHRQLCARESLFSRAGLAERHGSVDARHWRQKIRVKRWHELDVRESQLWWLEGSSWLSSVAVSGNVSWADSYRPACSWPTATAGYVSECCESLRRRGNKCKTWSSNWSPLTDWPAPGTPATERGELMDRFIIDEVENWGRRARACERIIESFYPDKREEKANSD